MMIFNLSPRWRLPLIVLLPQLLFVGLSPEKRPSSPMPEAYHTRDDGQSSFANNNSQEAPRDANS